MKQILALSAGVAVALASLVARADLHCVIVADLANTTNDAAYLDFASDQAPGVRYFVAPSTLPAPPAIQLGDKQFATSPNLIPYATSFPFLACAKSVDGNIPPNDLFVPSTAMLRQNKLVMEVPPLQEAAGTVFAFALGHLGQGAMLFIANSDVNPTDSNVQILPSPNSAIQTVVVPLNGVVTIPLTVSQTRVAVQSDLPLIVQLGILRKGKDFSMTMIRPMAP